MLPITTTGAVMVMEVVNPGHLEPLPLAVSDQTRTLVEVCLARILIRVRRSVLPTLHRLLLEQAQLLVLAILLALYLEEISPPHPYSARLLALLNPVCFQVLAREDLEVTPAEQEQGLDQVVDCLVAAPISHLPDLVLVVALVDLAKLLAAQVHLVVLPLPLLHSEEQALLGSLDLGRRTKTRHRISLRSALGRPRNLSKVVLVCLVRQILTPAVAVSSETTLNHKPGAPHFSEIPALSQVLVVCSEPATTSNRNLVCLAVGALVPARLALAERDSGVEEPGGVVCLGLRINNLLVVACSEANLQNLAVYLARPAKLVQILPRALGDPVSLVVLVPLKTSSHRVRPLGHPRCLVLRSPNRSNSPKQMDSKHPFLMETLMAVNRYFPDFRHQILPHLVL